MSLAIGLNPLKPDSSPVYPFTAILGQEKMKIGLLLTLIHPRIGGLLIRGQRGTAKSTAVRGLTHLLPPVELVADCPFRCPPRDPEGMCDLCRERLGKGQTLPSLTAPYGLVNLPLGASEDRLIGALVAFRHQQSRLIQPFTGNLGRVRQSLRQLPLGGKTPLSEGLRLGFRALAQERFKYPRSGQVLVLVSDGKPNLSFSGLDPLDEAFQTAAWLRRNGIVFVFIDTEPNPLAFGFGPSIARKAGGTYRTLVDLLKSPAS
jgi:hypothetical protein